MLNYRYPSALRASGFNINDQWADGRCWTRAIQVRSSKCVLRMFPEQCGRISSTLFWQVEKEQIEKAMWVLILPARDYYHTDKWRTTSHLPKHQWTTWFPRWDAQQHEASYKAVKTLSGGWKWSKPKSQMVETNPAASGTQQCVGALSIQNIQGVWETHFYICSMSGWESTCLLFRLDATEFVGFS